MDFDEYHNDDEEKYDENEETDGLSAPTAPPGFDFTEDDMVSYCFLTLFIHP